LNYTIELNGLSSICSAMPLKLMKGIIDVSSFTL